MWVPITSLAQEYWCPNIIFFNVSSLGTHIFFDNKTSKSIFDRSFSHYAKLSVDVDLTPKFHDQILVKENDFLFMWEWNMRNYWIFLITASTLVILLLLAKKLKLIVKRGRWIT